MNKEIWVVCDHVPDGKADIIFGMLTKAFDLAKKADCHTTAVCFGKHSSEYMQELFYYGTENVLHIEHDNVSKTPFDDIIESYNKRGRVLVK